MKYTVSYKNPNQHYIDFELWVETNGESSLEFQLPAWRPGRYELGNFAKNIQQWQAYDEDGNDLSFQKLSKDLWQVECDAASKVCVRYNYFAFELNAGSTFLDENQLYINPVNCFLYLPKRQNETIELKLDIPTSYEVAIALNEIRPRVYQTKNFDELADSPFIASASLQVNKFTEGGTTFYVWFQGEVKPDWDKLISDFKAYTAEQIKLFGDFPVEEYHYLFQIHTQSAYHGVEHSASTVISLGPSYSLFDKTARYDDLLGVSSHELFHTWNVKRIRPIEMVPYDFSKENYSRLGYLAEGATTWYGDLMLYRSKVFDDASYFKTFNQLLDRHFNNPGVENLSVADSSFDTWLDGYVMGVPNRKSSIYVEGALITFILDIEIRRQTKNQKSFDDVLRTFYKDFYKSGKGVSEADYQQTVESIAGKDLSAFFDAHVNGAQNIEKALQNAMDYIGFAYKKQASANYHESYLGFKLIDDKVLSIYPGSVADQAGLSVQDQLVSINGIKIKDNCSNWCNYFKGEALNFQFISAQGKIKAIEMKENGELFYGQFKVSKQENLSSSQKEAFRAWFQT